MRGKVVLITGATSGIGRAAAAELARVGARVLLHGRNRRRTERAASEIRREVPGAEVNPVVADLSRLASVRELALDVQRRAPRLDALINNAAVVTRSHQRTEDGYELQWVVNHLAPFLLTNLLVPRLIDSAPARIVFVASQVHRGAGPEVLHGGDPFSPHEYDPRTTYKRTKLANVLVTLEFARRLAGTGVTVNCLHPGVIATRLLASLQGRSSVSMRLRPRGARSKEDGSATLVYLASSPEVEGVSGKYFVDCRPEDPSEFALSVAVAERLWQLSAQQTGIAAESAPGPA